MHVPSILRFGCWNDSLLYQHLKKSDDQFKLMDGWMDGEWEIFRNVSSFSHIQCCILALRHLLTYLLIKCQDIYKVRVLNQRSTQTKRRRRRRGWWKSQIKYVFQFESGFCVNETMTAWKQRPVAIPFIYDWFGGFFFAPLSYSSYSVSSIS